MSRFTRAALITRATLTLVIAALVSVSSFAHAQQVRQGQPDPNSPRYKGVVALDEFLQSEGDEAIQHFIETRIAASVRESMGDEKLAETLAAIRAEAGGAEVRGGRPISELAAELVLDAGGSEMSISFELDPSDTDRFVLIMSPAHTIG